MQVTFFGLQFFYDDLIEYPKGHYLLKEGETQNCIYVLKKGAVKILKNSQEIALCEAVARSARTESWVEI